MMNRSGFLEKKGADVMGLYKRRFFELSGPRLNYSDGEGKPLKGFMDLRGANISAEGDTCIIVEGPYCKRRFFLRCASKEETQEWIADLELATAKSDEGKSPPALVEGGSPSSAEFDEPSPTGSIGPTGPLHEAAKEGDIESAKAHTAEHPEAGTDRDDNENTPAMVAARANQAAFLEWAIGEGWALASPAHRLSTGASCLHIAAEAGNQEATKVLVEKAGLGEMDKGACCATPPYFATHRDQHAFLEWASSELGWDLGAHRNVTGSTCLHIAAGEGFIESARVLIQAGVGVMEKNNSGFTPVHVAIANDQAAFLEWGVGEGWDLQDEAHCQDGNCLHTAAMKGCTNVARVLLKAGLDPATQDGSGKTPYQVAAEMGHDQFVEFWKEQGLPTE